jgi:hypothetical protein
MRKLTTLREALTNKLLLGSMLGGESFTVMRTLLIASMGEPLTPEEMEIFTRITARTYAPSEAVECT